MNEWVDGWMDEWMDGWVHEWMGGQLMVDGWLAGLING